ncbi:T9SS type A sorting domain-containing protein, partial [Ignavibacterium sp.]|uniref:T9SS type A sorting domain-containing protein n=1 Tax=Ignavibacterium sp. TaxID=2651167 RepID=UPI00307FC31F
MKNLFLFIWLLLLLFYSQHSLVAQISEGGIPIGYSLSTEGIPVITMPTIDKKALLEEDAYEESLGIPFRFGFPHEVSIDFMKQAKKDILPDGTALFRLKIVAPEATTINFTYSDFYLPAGAKYFIYAENRSEVIGAFTSRNNKEDGLFATGLVRGESVILECQVPGYRIEQTQIVIATVVHGYKDVFASYNEWEDFGQSGSCNINVKCPEGQPWENEIRSVAMILTAGGSRLCSGVMVNNVRQDLTPYFLTANHCLISSPNTWIIMFNYQSPSCANIDGPLNYTVSGTQTKANNSASDFALLLLNESPPDTYYVHYAGWSVVDVPADSGVGIHHPSGDIKKISFSGQAFEHDSWSGTPANSHWRVRWHPAGLRGVTEPGSSGSPIFDQNHRIVGQLHGGPSSCTASDKSDLYGKFSMSWNYGTTPSTRLKDWLDPDNTGTLILDGWDPSMVPPDTVAPTTITDLQVIDPTSNSLKLMWTAPFDTTQGGVRKYTIRYSTSPITDTIAFNNATNISNNLQPKTPGQIETFTVTGLPFSSTFYFAIRSNDRWNNFSNVSNSASGTTLAAPVISVNPASMLKVLMPNTTVIDSITVSNTSASASTLNFTVSLENNTFPSEAIDIKLVPKNLVQSEGNSDEMKNSDKERKGMSIEGQGGPDIFGYRWIDSDEPNGPQYLWNDIVGATGAVQVTSWTGTLDDGYATIPLGMTFPFYGNNYTQAYLSTNGFLSFTALTVSYFTNGTIPNAALPNNVIAPFWDDLDGRTQGTVHYLQEPGKLTIQFTNWQKYSGTGSLTFQVVLYSSGKIMFYYNNMNATLNSATVGIENSTGTDGLQIAYNANYVHNTMAVKIEAAPEWLINNIFSGTVYNGNSMAIQLTFKTEDYPLGSYSMDVVISSNDPLTPSVTVPVQMEIVIPVELAGFSAKNDRDNVIIQWQTATETNNQGFELQRRLNGTESWTVAGYVSGKGTTTERQDYQYIDKQLKAGRYIYRLKQIDLDGTIEYSQEIEVEVAVPDEYVLYQNYPNPFNPATTIEFSLPEKSEVVLSIYNSLGEKVREIVNGSMEAGYQRVVFDARELPSGTYVYQINAKGSTKSFIQSKKMALV